MLFVYRIIWKLCRWCYSCREYHIFLLFLSISFLLIDVNSIRIRSNCSQAIRIIKTSHFTLLTSIKLGCKTFSNCTQTKLLLINGLPHHCTQQADSALRLYKMFIRRKTKDVIMYTHIKSLVSRISAILYLKF